MFSAGDFLVRIGRYFDRMAVDTSGLTFEEWTPPDGSSFVIEVSHDSKGRAFKSSWATYRQMKWRWRENKWRVHLEAD